MNLEQAEIFLQHFESFVDAHEMNVTIKSAHLDLLKALDQSLKVVPGQLTIDQKTNAQLSRSLLELDQISKEIVLLKDQITKIIAHSKPLMLVVG